jgi:Flp pilus assembly protein TadG
MLISILSRLISWNRGRGKRGAGALEMAFILPAFLAGTFGVVEFGYLYFAHSTVNKAAEMGARFAVTGEGEVEGNRVPLIKENTKKLTEKLAGAEASGSADPIKVFVRSYPEITGMGSVRENDAGEPCELVEVQVKYSYKPMTLVMDPFFPSGFTIEGKKRMINEPWLPCDKE